ncbi:hypothetical protein GGR54DRAFT_623626, partial [Hypoxylon sp. NC1633]
PRDLDITCCDIEPAIIARNVLLFSLLVDGVNGNDAWDVYFHLRVSQDLTKLVKDQARKIISLSSSIDKWNQGQYGSVLKFCDANSLQQVRQIWTKYASPQSKSNAAFEKDMEHAPAFEKDLDRARDLMAVLRGLPDGSPQLDLTSLRSAAPLVLAELASPRGFVSAKEHFWEHGAFSEQPEASPNPLFSETLSPNTFLHYGTNPISGFHLATAAANLAPTSPLRPAAEDDAKTLKIAIAAKTQFREWAAAFQAISEQHITLRFAVCDALSFSYALQSISASGSKSACLFRRQLDSSAVEFDPATYATTNSAPTKFDVIDTSNLADHLGGLNILVAVSPLLKSSASSTIWIETLLKTEKTIKQRFDKLLRGHAPTVSLLLGLTPVDYWTNATSVSCVDEFVVHSLASAGQRQALSRLAWKLNSSLFPQPGHHGPTNVDSSTLARAVLQLYTKIFDIEDPTTIMNISGPEGHKEVVDRIKNNGYPLFHRGGFTALLKRIRTNISTDWPSFWNKFLRMIDQDKKKDKTLRSLYRQELGTQLHIQGLHTEQWMKDKICSNPNAGGFNAWNNIPEVVCVTVVVPRSRIDILYSTELSKLNAPTLEGVLESKNVSWQNYYADVHVVFGRVETSGNRKADEFSLTVSQDALGWQGKSPLVASFYVASSALQVEPKGLRVGILVQNTALNIATYKHLQPVMTVYKTEVTNASSVFITKFAPGMTGYPFTGDITASTAGNDNASAAACPTAQIAANLQSNKVKTLLAHLDFSSSEEGKALLAQRVPVELQQSSPSTIDVVFGQKKLVCPISFPIPVVKEYTKTRIARTSGYVELVARLAHPLASGSLSSFIYPITLGEKSVPLLLNSPHVNLDSLPILDLDESHKKNNEWLHTLASHQISVRERRIRDSDVPPPLRINFKDTLFSMFMLASGLQGGQTGLFALQHPEDGNQDLIFIRTIQLNGPEASVVADAAVIPMTRELVDSGELETFLLVLRELQMCAIKVDDEELVLWKKILPAFAERCRTWTHGPECEYKKAGATIPLSTQMGKQYMCSCGKGKLPKHFISLPEWDDVASRHAVRIAVSPTFSAPSVEDIVDFDLLNTQTQLGRLQLDKCRGCNATEAKSGGALLRCGRCKDAAYCSAECQRSDWKKHRMECKPQGVS